MAFSKSTKYCIALFVLILGAEGLMAQTILKDRRVKDINLTPKLGRGYSLSTNTYASTCLKDVVVTEPSYDFSFDLTSLDFSNSFKNVRNMGPNSARVDRPVTELEGNGSKMVTKIINKYRTDEKLTQTGKGEKQFVHVEIKVLTYYASVEESATPLSDSAAALLKRNDVPGFFSACGSYYVRGLNREAKMEALFEYTVNSGESKEAYKEYITEQILAVDTSECATGSLNCTNAVSGNTVSVIDDNVANESHYESKNWKIHFGATGLGKNSGTNLIAFTMPEFREAVKTAFTAMQTAGTGRVVSAELVPWAENTQFQSNLDMTGKDVVGEETVQLYRKKDILSSNAEFLAELNRSSRIRQNRYYLARNCKNDLDMNDYPEADYLENHETGVAGVTVGELKQFVDGTKVMDQLWKQDYIDWLATYDTCVKDLLSGSEPVRISARARLKSALGDDLQTIEQKIAQEGRGLYLSRWTIHDSCTQIKMIPEAYEGWGILESHCMPKYFGDAVKRNQSLGLDADGNPIEESVVPAAATPQ